MEKVTAKDIMKRYEERNSAQNNVQSSYASNSIRNVTAEEIMNSYSAKSEESTTQNYTRSIPNQSTIEETTLKQKNQNYASSKLDVLTLAQEKAIKDYNFAMKQYINASLMNPSDVLVGTNNAMSYYNDAMKIKRNSGMDSDTFDSYADNWDQLQDLQKSKKYEEKTAAVLQELTQSQQEELDKYNLSIQQYKNKNIQNASMGLGVSMEDYDAAVSLKREFMNKYGVSSEDFDKFAQYVQESQDRKSTNALQSDIQADIKENPVGAGILYTGLDILTSPIAGMLAAGETLKSFGYADKDAPVNTDSYLYALQNIGTATEEQVLEKIDNPVGDFAYNVGVSTAKSAMGLALGSEPLTLASFGASAYSSALKNAQDKGITKERAMVSALGAGAAEVAFEKLSLDHLYDMYKSVGKTALKDTVKNIFIQSGIEGSEEVFTELANIITDNVVNGEFSDYGTNVRNYQAQGLSADEAKKQANVDAALQVGEAFLAGVISGGVMGGGTTAVSKINYHNIGKRINQDVDVKSKIIEVAQTLDEKTTAKEIVANNKAEDITDEQMGQIVESMAEVDSNMVTQIFSEIAPVQEKSSEQDESTQAIMDALEQVKATSGDKTMQLDSGNVQIDNVNVGIDNTITQNSTERNHGVTRATLTGTNEQVVALKFDEVSKNTATVRLGNDTVVPLSEVQMNDRTMQQLYNFASSVENTHAANAMLDRYEGQPMEVYARACIVFYNAGQLKTASFDEMVHNSKNAQLVAGMGDKATLYQMFELGRNSASNIAPVQIENKVTKQKNTEGKVIDNRTDKSESRLLDLYTLVAKRTGLDIELNDTLEHGARGNFTASLGKITLSNKADNQYEVLVHELLEYASSYNPQKMQEVYDMVLRYAMSDMGVEKLTASIKAYQSAYEQVEHGKTFQSASEEYVHDYLAGVFSTEEGVRDFVNFMTKENVSLDQQRSILQTVADFFRDIAKKISQYVDEHMLSDAAKMGLRADIQQTQKMRQMVLDVLEDTIGNEMSGVNDTDVVFSLKVDENGVETYTTSEDVKALSYKERKERFLQYMKKKYKGRTAKFTKDGNVYYAFFDENGINKGVFGDKKSSKKGYKAKINIGAEGNYIELSENALYTGSSIEQGKRNRFHKNAKEWDYFEKIVKCDGVYYDVLINVKDAGNDQYVYDITLKEAALLPDSQGSYDGSSTTSNIIIAQSSENTTKKSLKVEITEDSEGKELTENQRKYFKNAKTVDEEGNLKRFYHGTARGDRVGYYFNPDRATSGPMAFFTDSQEIAGDYAKNKKDTSIAYDSAYDSYETQFRVERNGRNMSVIELWDTLPIGLRNEMKEKAKHITMDDDWENVIYDKNTEYGLGNFDAYELSRHKGNVLHTLVDSWLTDGNIYGEEHKFLDVLKLLEITDAQYMDPNKRREKVYEVYLNITNPLSTEALDQQFVNELKSWLDNTDLSAYESETASADMWDKNSIDPYEWLDRIQDDVKNGTTRAWTSIPDAITAFLKEKGYDGILDLGGKGGGVGHQVAIPFYSNQIKAINNENPTEDVDIRLSLDVDLMSILEEEYSKEENESASIIEEGFASLQNVNVDKKTMHKLAYKLKKEYKSAYSIDDLTDNLTNVFAYLKDHPDAKYEDMLRIMREVARPVIEESTDIDTWEKAMYDNFRSYFKGKTIRLNRGQIAEVAHYYGSFENFRRQNFGSINFSAKNGTYLDSIWEELVQQSDFMLESDTYDADQPIALVDTLQALKPVKKNIYGMNTEQASYDLALDIFRQFFVEQAQEKANEKVAKKAVRLVERQQEYRKRVHKEFEEAKARIREYDREKRENLRIKYQLELNDAKKSMYAAVKDHDKDAAKKYEKMEQFYQEQIRLLNQENNEKILAIKAANRQNMANRRSYEEQKRVRERIVRNAKGIINYFNTNTDKRHIPETLKTPIAQFITSIDFISEKANPNSAATLAWQDSLNLMYRRLTDKGQASENGYEDVYAALNGENGAGDVLKDMSAFLDQCAGKRVTDLSVRELEWLDGIITALKRAITDINRLYVNKRTQSVAELGTQSIQELLEKKDKKSHAILVEKGVNVMDANMLDSRSYFDRLGEAAFSIYDELRTAFNDRVWLLKEAQDYLTNALEGLDVKKWTGENAQVHDFVINGQHLQMTTAQIMSLYELNKRNQAKLHMTVGGIRPTVIGKGSKQIKRVTAVKLTSRDIDTICNTLTAEQKAVADKIQKFLADNCAKWGNKASMQMYGYERFGAKNYFPIRTDGNTVDTKDDSKFWFTKNQGFTKETVKNASNPLIVSDIFEVFTKHVTDMASYSTYSAAMMDAMKWYNFRSTDLQGDVVVYDDAVKTQIERVYGNTYLEYFKKLIEDINAENKRGIESEIAELLTSNMKAASVGANLRVAIQQPTAYLRAAAVMSPKYLSKAVFKKSAMKKAKEHSAITLWKSWGYFETSIGRSMQNVLTGQKTWKEKAVDRSMAMAQFMDDFTWGYLWNACELEISDKHKEMKYDSPEYLKLVSKRFDEVVDQTQVVDTVLHRSHIMRSKNLFNKMVTSFMSEPTKSYNLLMNRVRDVYEAKPEGKDAAKKVLARAVNAYVVTQILNAAVVSIIDAFRDWEDDKKTFVEKYLENFKENAVDNVNPLTMIPYAKDLISIVEGYDVNRQDMQGMSTLINGGRKVLKYVTDEEYSGKHTLWEVCKELIKGGSQVYGVPVYNPIRDIEAIWNTIFPDMRIGGRIYSKTEDYNNLLDGLLENDKETYDRAYHDLIDKGMEEGDIPGKIISKMKERYEEGALSKEDAVKLMIEELNYDEDDAWFKVNREWEYGSKYGLLYNNIDYAFDTGNTSDRRAIETEIKELLEHGVEKSDIVAGITRKYKEGFIENPSANMKNLLLTCYMYCGYTRDEAMKKIEKWSE